MEEGAGLLCTHPQCDSMHRGNGGLFLSCKCRFVLCSAQMNTAVVNMELWVLQKGILVALVLAGLDVRALEFGSCLGTEVKCCERCVSTRGWVLQGALHQEVGAAGCPAMHQGVARCHAVHQGHILPLTCWDFSHVGALCHVHPVGPWGFLAPPGTC